MPFLIALPVAVLILVMLMLVLLPFGLVQRYRTGTARRRAYWWLVRLNAWLLLVSTALFALGAWITGHWVPHAPSYAIAGLGLGAVLGIVGAWTTRFERQPDGLLHYTPNRWLVLALTLLVVARIVLGVWQVWRSPPPGEAGLLATLLADHGNLFGVGGVLLGYALAYAWCIAARTPRRSRASSRP